MINAKQELLQLLEGKAKVKCAVITNGDDYDDDKKEIRLKVGYENFDDFLKEMDFDYSNGYGGQNLFGTIWLEDGTWCSRGEYDGSEWWEHNVLPAIPAECL